MEKIILLTVFFLSLVFVVPFQTVRAGAVGCVDCCISASDCAGYARYEACSPMTGATYYACGTRHPSGRGDCIWGCGVCNVCNNYPSGDCGIAYENSCSGGGGSGDYQYFKCPDGQVKSCGSPAEADAQDKYKCFNRAYCDSYFSPELIGIGCDADNPAKANCQWNCSCCPVGSSRTCTQGSPDTVYTVDVRIELPLDEAGIAAKVSCAQWHGHDDIFVSNDCLPIGQNCNNHDGQWQDWQLTCIHNDCGCATPPTPTPPAPKKSARTSKPRGTIFAAAT